MDTQPPPQSPTPHAPQHAPPHSSQQEDFDEPRQPNKLKRHIQECIRVLKVTKKPTMQEFKTIVKVSGAGILLIGVIGFAMHLVKELLLK